MLELMKPVNIHMISRGKVVQHNITNEAFETTDLEPATPEVTEYTHDQTEFKSQQQFELQANRTH
jgi:hypothetical protein